jgi:hypothetical protein
MILSHLYRFGFEIAKEVLAKSLSPLLVAIIFQIGITTISLIYVYVIFWENINILIEEKLLDLQ